ncbi:MAG: orotidine-5'-phosphate decarboxylase [Gammaproteobacteria bacterium]|nr:MAG: orotidine-5'-phosphate decarboxylase [Gammaproteobacteria bacterium]
MNDPRIIVALDFPDTQQALEFSQKTTPQQCRLKVGKELFTSAGPALVEALIDSGYDVFLDLKYHDIPNTVERAAAAAARLGVWMLNVHALGGAAMMRAAREGVESVAQRPFLIAVTVLTSMSADDLQALGIETPLPQMVERLTHSALDCGLDGVVCSAREVPALRASVGQSALLVTPGIRPDWAAANDQQRIVTPQQALADGASYLVIGRPVTQHPDPAEALRRITQSIS